MSRRKLWISAIAVAAASLPGVAGNYGARKAAVDGVEVVVLSDAARKTEVTVIPSVGNIGYEMKVNGKNVLWVPEGGPAKFKAKPMLSGIPLLAPWANRLDQQGFFANGKQYLFNMTLGNVRGKIPIHGFLWASPAWEVVEVRADGKAAWVRSRLEFWRHPDMMAQFPFAHTIEMAYRLREGELEVETRLVNHAREPMPVAIGFHPYFRLHELPRDQWKIHVPVKEHWVLDANNLPTGEVKPADFPEELELAGRTFDDVYTGLARSKEGRAEFWVRAEKEKISVLFGPKYTTLVLWVPKGREFLCFEPMAAITNGLNLAHRGLYKELQSIPPGGEWRESFWIRPSGF